MNKFLIVTLPEKATKAAKEAAEKAAGLTSGDPSLD
jgi:hypothetical protein